MNVTQAAEMLGVSRKVVDRLIRDGKLKAERHPLKLRGEKLIPAADIERIKQEITRERS